MPTSLEQPKSATRPQSVHNQSWQEWLTSSPVLLRFTLLLTFLAYVRTVTFDWVYDDHYQVTLNPWLDSWGSLKQIFTLHSWAFSDISAPAKFYRPMYLVWLLVNNQLFHGTPGWFHLTGVGLHLVVVYLAYLTARRLLGDDRLGVIAALIFGLHPTKVEAVAWVAGLTEVVLAAFFFGTILAYLRWQQSDERSAKWLWISAASFGGAIFSKETAVLAPVLILAYDWMSTESGQRSISKVLRLGVPYALVGAMYFLVRLRILSGVADLGGKLSVSKTFYTLPIAFWWYVKHTLWPFGLRFHYPEMIVRTPSDIWFVLPAIALVCAVAAYIWFTRRSHLLQFLGLWCVLTIAPPVVAILLLQPHDRYLYLPTFAFAVMVSLALKQLRPYSTKALPFIIVIAIGFSLGTLNEERYWETDLKLFSRALEKDPDNMVIVSMAGGTLLADGQKQKGLDILLDGFRRHPDSVNVSYALAEVYFTSHELDEAKKYFDRTLAITDNNFVRAKCYFQLGMIAQDQGDPTTAEAQLRQAIALKPSSAGFHQALANVLKQTGRPEEAKREFDAEQEVRRTRTRNF